MRKSSLFACLLVAFGTAQAADLVIHEWGTITTIHDAAGNPATGLNRIDEADVLPSFVHRYEPATTRQPQRQLGKSPLVPGRPDVTMRLETPVIYFHPPPNKKYDNPIDVTVRFRGGVLNEFYPDAEASVALDTPRVHDKMEAGVITGMERRRAQQLRRRHAAMERPAPARHRGRAADPQRNLARAARGEFRQRVQSGGG